MSGLTVPRTETLLRNSTREVVSVRRFGADPNRADNTGPIKAAMEAVPDGTTLVIPPGTHNCPSWTVFDTAKNLSVICEGEIVGNNVNNSTGDFIRVRDDQRLKWDGGVIRDFRFAFSLGEPQSIDIRNARITECRRGVVGDGVNIGQVVIHDCEISDLEDANTFGIAIRYENIGLIDIARCYIHDLESTGSGATAIIIGKTSGRVDAGPVNIRQNRIVDIKNPSTTASTRGIVNFARYAKIEDNYCEGIEAATGSNDDEAIYTKGFGTLIRGNTCVNCSHGEAVINNKGSAFEVDPADGGHSVSILNNTVIYDGIARVNRAIKSVTSDALIQGNRGYGLTRGIVFDGDDVRILDNYLRLDADDATTKVAINMFNASRFTIRGNEFPGMGAGSEICWVIRPTGNCSDGDIANNKAFVASSSTSSRFVVFGHGAGQTMDRFRINNNQMEGFQRAVHYAGDGDVTNLQVRDTVSESGFSGLVHSSLVEETDFGTLRGEGSPENAVPAKVGTIYIRLDGGADTTLYVKESGTGNTGWVAK